MMVAALVEWRRRRRRRRLDGQRDEAVVLRDVALEDVGAGTQDTFESVNNKAREERDLI